MNKPQVNITLYLDSQKLARDCNGVEAGKAIATLVDHARLVQEQIAIVAIHDGVEMSARPEPAQHTSRHHQSVAANTRIMDAIEFINKEMRLLKGHSENGTLKVFEELKSILLGI